MKLIYKIENNKIILTQNVQEKYQILFFINPDNDEKIFIKNNFNIDEHSLNSALDPDEQARIEINENYSLIIFKKPRNYSAKDQFLFKVISIGIFIFNDFMLILTTEDIPIFEGKQFDKVNSFIDITLKIIYRSIFHFLEHLKVINMISDELETKINTSMENKYLINLFTLEKSLVYYLNAINSNNFVIEKIKLNSQKLNLSKNDLELLEDIIIENNQCYKQAEIYSNILAGMMDARVSIVSNNLNVLMKTLNIITIGIMVPTFVVSAFSMNVKIPLAAHPYAFWFVMLLSIFSVLIFIFIWKYKKW
ncbi:MAG TPA: magnesium transporter CorA family protein [bacterium]|nr:magnesium transporter CorA family protein [bacterium]HOL47387.1 magnesium transporter CorA family protein [bacterium]HPQ18114.1 magnesium transporter CorA family protein [bacterium]